MVTRIVTAPHDRSETVYEVVSLERKMHLSGHRRRRILGWPQQAPWARSLLAMNLVLDDW
jgi:hypothetical protein